jgi:hypothetical protein
MKKVLLFLVLAMAAVSIPLTAMGDLMRSPPSTELDLLGNVSLDGSYLVFKQGKQNIVSVYTFSKNDAAWEQFALGDINWTKYSAQGHGVFEVADLTTYSWGDSDYGKTPTSFTIDFHNNIGNMFTSLGDYNFDICGDKKFSVAGNFEAMPAAPVPEPSTMILLSAGIIGLVGTRLKGRKKKS